MPVSTSFLVPFVSVEFDASQAQQGPSVLPYTAILVGQKLAAGSAAANAILPVTSPEQVMAYAGRGSMLHLMAKRWFEANKSTKVYIGVLADDGAGVAASGTITVTGPATAAGTIALYIGGQRITVAVASGDAQNTIASAINAAINAALDLPVTSSVATNVVTVTHRHKGLVGNSTDVRHSYQDGEALPSGVALAIVALASGTTAPVLTTLLANMGDQWFHIWAHPYTDATNLSAIEAKLVERFGPLKMIDGVAITSAAGTHASLVTLGDGRNSPHSAIVAQPGKNPLIPPPEFASHAAGIVAYYGQADPARPFQTLPMVSSILPPADVDLFTLDERNLLLQDGIATTAVGAGKVVQLERMVTTYQVNAGGAADAAYRDVTTMLTLMYLRYAFRARMTSRYPRHKLANDGTRFGPGQFVITPKIGKGEACAWFRQMEELGLVENFDQFKRDLVVVRNGTDVNRLDFTLPCDLVNFLAHAAALMQFRL